MKMVLFIVHGLKLGVSIGMSDRSKAGVSNCEFLISLSL